LPARIRDLARHQTRSEREEKRELYAGSMPPNQPMADSDRPATRLLEVIMPPSYIVSVYPKPSHAADVPVVWSAVDPLRQNRYL
jgi:hypothetical protein